MFTVEQRIWTGQPQGNSTDHRGENRWCVLDDGFVYDHFATEAEAVEIAAQLNEEIDPITDLPYA